MVSQLSVFVPCCTISVSAEGQILPKETDRWDSAGFLLLSHPLNMYMSLLGRTVCRGTFAGLVILV